MMCFVFIIAHTMTLFHNRNNNIKHAIYQMSPAFEEFVIVEDIDPTTELHITIHTDRIDNTMYQVCVTRKTKKENG